MEPGGGAEQHPLLAPSIVVGVVPMLTGIHFMVDMELHPQKCIKFFCLFKTLLFSYNFPFFL